MSGSYPYWVDRIIQNIPSISKDVCDYIDKKNKRIKYLESRVKDLKRR